MAALESTQAAADIDPAAYQAIFYTGGHGTMWDFKGNQDLKKKIADIASLEVRLAQNKAHLLSLIQLIDAKPDDVDSKDNAARVMESLGIVGKN